MATGYTAELTKKDVPFEKFVLTCAKAFLIRMRDRSGLIPARFEPFNYHEEEVRKNNVKLASLRAMSVKQANAEADKDYKKALKDRARYVEEVRLLRERLMTMRAKVTTWKPPSGDHEGLQKFMIQQLEDTLGHDGQVLGAPPEKKSGKDWKTGKISDLEDEIAYDEKRHQEEIRMVDRDNLWVRQLRGSLETP